ncbi:MAG: FkbM family methyltransferase [Tannerella sp.]|jgi:hypothetical protein|nr:FkbM family methyltransferase [Tannerella sp.]
MNKIKENTLKQILHAVVKNVYRSNINQNFRKIVFRRKILAFLRKNLIGDNCDYEKNEVLGYLEKNPLSMLPYEFTQKYKPDTVLVYTDKDCRMKYVMHENKRLYFSPAWKEKRIKEYYTMSLTEQDIASPHRYEYENFEVNDGDVVVDIGVAEGNFALSVVERAKKIYLFETEEDWVLALKKTFEPWREKVVIVNKFVSDHNTENEICLDDYFEDQEINFMKVDVEGAEMEVLQGARELLSNQKKLKIAICTYHKQNDAEIINSYLETNRFQTTFSKGYVICFWDRKLSAPWLRKGLIRATCKAIE